METTKFNIRLLEKIINCTTESYMDILFLIRNNALLDIEIQCFIEKKLDVNEIRIELYSYINDKTICNLCNYYDEFKYTNPILCKCKKKRTNLNKLFNKVIAIESMNINNHTIKGIQDKIETLSIEMLQFINVIKLCEKCNTYIYNNINLCANCCWQDKYNKSHGEILEDPCPICFNTIYITEAVTKCGNFSHSIHKSCDKQLKKCPICRGINDDDEF